MDDILAASWFRPVAGVLLAFVVILLVAQLLRRAIGRYVTDVDARYRARKAVSFAMLVAILLVVLLTVSGRLTGLAVALGAATAGIAFALQEVIASVAGWLAIIFGGFFRTGDRVELGKIRGDVIDIGVLRTTLMEIGEWVNGDRYTGRIVRVANSFVFKEPVFNYSGDFEFLWDEVRVAIRFGSDYEEARRIVQSAITGVTQAYSDGARSRWHELVKKYRLEDAQVDPFVLMSANKDWVEFTGRYVTDFRRRGATRDAIWQRILAGIESSGGRVSITSSTLQLIDQPPIRVDLGPPRDLG